jgi:hypothetical protein
VAQQTKCRTCACVTLASRVLKVLSTLQRPTLIATPGGRVGTRKQKWKQWLNIVRMTTPSALAEIDKTVQELRVEQHQSAFTHKLAHVVSAIGAIPDSPPEGFTVDDMARLRELAEETVEAIEQRLEGGGDGEKVQQKLAGTVYEVRKRMEAVEVWFRHFAPASDF